MTATPNPPAAANPTTTFRCHAEASGIGSLTGNVKPLALMSVIASFIKLPKTALDGLREAAVPKKVILAFSGISAWDSDAVSAVWARLVGNRQDHRPPTA